MQCSPARGGRLPAIGFLLGMLFLFAGCSSSDNKPPPQSPAAASVTASPEATAPSTSGAPTPQLSGTPAPQTVVRSPVASPTPSGSPAAPLTARQIRERDQVLTTQECIDAGLGA